MGSFLLQEEKCEDVTQGYTTEQKCTKWPKQVCDTRRERVKKFTPETECKKVPRQLCGPSGCVPQPGPEECFDKKETVVQEVRMGSVTNELEKIAVDQNLHAWYEESKSYQVC